MFITQPWRRTQHTLYGTVLRARARVRVAGEPLDKKMADTILIFNIFFFFFLNGNCSGINGEELHLTQFSPRN